MSARWTTLWTHERAVLACTEDAWAVASEIAKRAGEDGGTTVAVLRMLRRNELVVYRKNDTQGRGEWARTEYGNEVVASWKGTPWEVPA